jgi:hypothetical protein
VAAVADIVAIFAIILFEPIPREQASRLHKNLSLQFFSKNDRVIWQIADIDVASSTEICSSKPEYCPIIAIT